MNAGSAFRRVVLVCASVLVAFSLHAKIRFVDADINAADALTFLMHQSFSGTLPYSTAFTVPLKDGDAAYKARPITCFPEQMELISGGSALRIRNRYGIAHCTIKDGALLWKKTFATLPVNSMRAVPAAASPDGKWVCFIEKTRYASGTLILENTATGAAVVIDSDAAFSYTDVPVRWSADSSIFIYEKNKSLYFGKAEAFIKGIDADEAFRKICDGAIECAYWADGRTLVYIDGDIVYRVSAKELYTRSLYSDIIGCGTPIGRLPERFVPSKDIFAADAELSTLTVVKAMRFFFVYRIKKQAGSCMELLMSGTYTDPTASVIDARIALGRARTPVVLLELLPYSGAAKFSAVCAVDGSFFKRLNESSAAPPVLSPDRSKCAVISAHSLDIYESASWKKTAELAGERIIQALWKDDDTIIAGGERTVRLWSLRNNETKIIALSSADTVRWNAEGTAVLSDANGQSYAFDTNSCRWSQSGEATERDAVLQSAHHRVFLGETSNADYENALYVRRLRKKAATKALFAESVQQSAPKKKVALAFDAYGNADGVPAVLTALSQYQAPGTFFLNGEFIRRYPNETKQIAASGHECASMFFSLSAFEGERFVIDENFVRRGLARNEDEFSACTGQELSLLWHIPAYKENMSAFRFAQKSGYCVVHSAVRPHDLTSLEQSALTGAEYITAAAIIDRCIATLAKTGGGIVPVALGLLSGTRESYLYTHIDLLISALLDEGYEIVPVRSFIRKGGA